MVLTRQCRRLKMLSLRPALSSLSKGNHPVLQKCERRWHKLRLSLAQAEALKENKEGEPFLTTRANVLECHCMHGPPKISHIGVADNLSLFPKKVYGASIVPGTF